MGAVKRNFIPVRQVERDLILKIQKSVCNSDFMNKYRFNLIPETFDIYTTVIAFMDGIHSLFSKAEYDEINIGDILIITKTNRDKKKTEKLGNINCVMKLGPVGENIFNQGVEGFEDVLEEDIDMRKDMLAASALAVKYLEDYAVKGIKAEDVYHIAITFFTYMIITVKECIDNENINERDFILEIGSHLSYFDIRIKRPNMYLNVGPALKLTVKSDALTE
jgi:hypothetical protein